VAKQIYSLVAEAASKKPALLHRVSHVTVSRIFLARAVNAKHPSCKATIVQQHIAYLANPLEHYSIVLEYARVLINASHRPRSGY
jgi:hypothetical protein